MADTAGAIGAMLGVSAKRVYELYLKGMPRTKAGARKWYDGYKQEREAKRSATLEAARTRKTEAEAELAEIELAKARGELIAVSEVEAEVGALLDGLRSRLLAVPGKYGPVMVGKRTPAEGQAALEAMVTEVMGELSAE